VAPDRTSLVSTRHITKDRLTHLKHRRSLRFFLPVALTAAALDDVLRALLIDQPDTHPVLSFVHVFDFKQVARTALQCFAYGQEC
jgi:hypothetical protein